MSAKRHKLFQLEALERRDTPSAIVAAAVHHPAVHHPPVQHHRTPPHRHHTYAVNATVNATLSAPPVIANGNVTLASSATLVDRQLGTLSGTLAANFSLTGTTASAQGAFSASDGSELILAFSVTGSVAQGSFSGTFNVVSGTGHFAGATGSGSLSNGVLSVAGKSLAFNLSGKISV